MAGHKVLMYLGIYFNPKFSKIFIVALQIDLQETLTNKSIYNI